MEDRNGMESSDTWLYVLLGAIRAEIVQLEMMSDADYTEADDVRLQALYEQEEMINNLL